MKTSAVIDPPAGAMQFEVTLGPGKTVISVGLWVGPPESISALERRRMYGRIPGCICVQCWPVLEPLPEDYPDFVQWFHQVTWRGDRAAVCACIGRPIE